MYGTRTARVRRGDGGSSSTLRAQQREAFVAGDGLSPATAGSSEEDRPAAAGLRARPSRSTPDSVAWERAAREPSHGSAAVRAALQRAWARLRHRLPWLLAAAGLHALLLALFLLPQRARSSSSPAPLETQIITQSRVTRAPPPLKLLASVQTATRIVVPVPLVSVPDPTAIAATARPAPVASPVSAASSARPAPAPPITPPKFDAAYLHNPAPDYPLEARRVREEGTVMLRVEVSPEGRALTVLVDHSSGWRLLDVAAMSAVRRWRFVPARQGSDPVAAWVLVPIQFELRS